MLTIVTLLLHAGALANMRTRNGYTALMFGSSWSRSGRQNAYVAKARLGVVSNAGGTVMPVATLRCEK